MEDKRTLAKDNNAICLICGEPVPMSKNHREPVYIKGSRYCEDVCFDCIYKGGEYFVKNLAPGYHYCSECGDYSQADYCLGECMQMEIQKTESFLGKTVRTMSAFKDGVSVPVRVVAEDSIEEDGEEKTFVRVKDDASNIYEMWASTIFCIERKSDEVVV